MQPLKMILFCAAICCTSVPARAAEGKIIKVLPHLLDREGRHSLSPSLYERDAYQTHLRKNPEQCSTLRFDIQWKARAAHAGPLKLRVEARGSQGFKIESLVAEQPARRRGPFARWSSVRLPAEDYRKLGELIAWRVTLWDADQRVAEQQSFLW
jgi:hypothetical protein